MIAYSLKFVFCSSILFALYYIFLEREKIYRFNRFYLLFSILFSIVVPFISVDIPSASIPISEPAFLNNIPMQNSGIQLAIESTSDTNLVRITLIVLYLAISMYFIFRFIRNVFAVNFRIKNSTTISYLNAKLVFTNEKHLPFSFLQYIFVNGDDFKQNKIEDEILNHELIHVNQKHSFDILFLEFLLIFAWLNPALFLYKKAIQLNHEFLADESVVQFSGKKEDYQYLLIYKSERNLNLVLSSTFNFSPIKKRIIMMNKNGSPRIAMIKKIVVIPMIIIIGFLLTFKIVAQNIESGIEQNQVEVYQDGVSQKLLSEYQTIINKHKKLLKNGKYSTQMNGFTKEEQDRMQEIFNKMSHEQKLKQKFGFIPAKTMYLKEAVLTKEKLDLYKDSKMYGVWIDGKRIKNDDLNNFENTDFSQVFVSKLMKNAINYGNHYYQVDLMTNDYYRDYKNEVTSRTGAMLVPIKMYEKVVVD